MLGSVFILSGAILVAAGATIDPRCSRYSQGMEAQVLPYLPDCRKFVICDMGGNGQVLSCPKGLYFDVESHACSYEKDSCTHGELAGEADDVVPQVPVKPQPQVPVKPLPQVPVKPQPQVPVKPQPQVPVNPQPLPIQPNPLPVYPKPVQPIQPQPVPVPIQPPNFIPPVVAPDSKPLGPNILPIVTAPTTLAPIAEEQPDIHQLNICKDQAAGKVYPVSHDCGLYVVCMGNSKAIVQRCPKGLLYDGKQQRCEFASASFCATPRIDGNVVLDMHGVDMSLRTDDDESLDTPDYAVPVKPVEVIVHQPLEVIHQPQPILIVPEPEQKPEAVVENKFRIIDNHPRCLGRVNQALTLELPHETDCSKYLVCVGRTAIEKQCPPGQHWSAKNNWCDFVSAAGTGCNGTRGRSSRWYSPSTPVDNAAMDGRRCAFSVALLVGLALTSVQAAVTVTRDSRCPRVDDPEKTIHLTHPTDCNRFLVCSSGMAYEMRCPEGLEYDTEQRSCDYDYLVRCSERGRTQIQQANQPFEMPSGQLLLNRPAWNDPQEEPRVEAQQYKAPVSVVDARCPRTDDPMKPIHLPRTGNCNKFMKCFGGRAYEMDCPAGLEFNAKQNRCDYASLAGCSRM
ncbi:AGAP012132-PA-like protein [Anopheles sinensis]|uniref:AGAP012132-PA-like protein n=1 Tax=Anopheles sinensis TaxID=74873 RepID=A0A084WM70_ANOSI|nr:AGAP012132-PA-like protein [Anopheles sinensis]